MIVYHILLFEHSYQSFPNNFLSLVKNVNFCFPLRRKNKSELDFMTVIATIFFQRYNRL